MKQSIDPLQLTLIWNRLIAVVEEQAQTLIRTAFSTTVREAGDLSAGVFNREGQMLAQAVTGTPGHVNAMAASVAAFLAKHPMESLHEGDVLVTNDPWDGTGHLNDFTVVTPVFHHGQPIGLFAATSHIADVGGLGFGPDANDLFEEGLLIPISFLFKQGEPNETLFNVLRANVRDPLAAEGDLYSLAACNETGIKRLIETLNEFGLIDLEAVGAQIIKQSQEAMIAEINALPDGEYNYAMRIDGYNDPIDLVCKLMVRAGAIEIDFSGTSKASSHGINVPLTYTQAYASFGARCVIGNMIPNNAGSLAPISILAPATTILNAQRPAAVSARHVIGQMLPDVVLGALAKAMPGRTPAEGTSCLYLPVLRSVADAKEPFVINPFYTGGTGARPGKDGLSCTAFPSGVKNTPVEINEATAPVIMWRKEYIADSGGVGQYRGGLGQVMEFQHARDEDMIASKMFDRIKHPARGRKEGGAGGNGQVRLASGTMLKGMGRDVILGGDRLVVETPGGGGIGDSAARADDAVRQDVKKGFVSQESAEKNYNLLSRKLSEK